MGSWLQAGWNQNSSVGRPLDWRHKGPWFNPRFCQTNTFWGFPGGSVGKESACNVGDLGLIPGLGRFPKGGHGNPLQYSCLENPMDGGVCWATVHGVTKSWTPERLSRAQWQAGSTVGLVTGLLGRSRLGLWCCPTPVCLGYSGHTLFTVSWVTALLGYRVLWLQLASVTDSLDLCL